VTDSEYIAKVPLKEKQLVTHRIYSNSKQILEQHKFIFEVLCEKAIPALWHFAWYSLNNFTSKV
jgi:mannosyltransferase OCH1-like enzyme